MCCFLIVSCPKNVIFASFEDAGSLILSTLSVRTKTPKLVKMTFLEQIQNTNSLILWLRGGFCESGSPVVSRMYFILRCHDRQLPSELIQTSFSGV